MASADRLMILLCHDRSGSSLFQDLLRKHPDIAIAGELWNFQAFDDTHPLSFYGYRKRRAARRPESLLPRAHEIYALLDGFFDGVLAAFAEPRVIVDVKYAHLPSLEGDWFAPAFGSLFLQYLRDREIRLIHLHRRDVFAAAVSRHLAARRGVYSTRDVKSLKPVVLRLCRASLALQLESLASDIRVWQYCCSKLAVLDLTYEDLRRSLDSPARFFRPVEAYLGVPPHNAYATDLIKTSPEPSDFIENFAELADLAQAFGSVG